MRRHALQVRAEISESFDDGGVRLEGQVVLAKGQGEFVRVRIHATTLQRRAGCIKELPPKMSHEPGCHQEPSEPHRGDWRCLPKRRRSPKATSGLDTTKPSSPGQ